MKIFNTELGKEKVYVQINDLMLLNDSIEPKSIYEKFLNYIETGCSCYRNNFIMFEEIEEVSFFKRANWIVDYKKEKQLDIDKIRKKRKILIEQIDKIENKYYDSVDLLHAENLEIMANYEKLMCMVYSYDRIIEIKLGCSSLKLPIVADSDSYETSMLPGYNIQTDFSENSLFISKKDGQLITRTDIIADDKLKGIMLALLKDKRIFEHELCVKKIISDDLNYLIIYFDNKTIESIQHSKIKTLIKSIFKKKNV